MDSPAALRLAGSARRAGLALWALLGVPIAAGAATAAPAVAAPSTVAPAAPAPQELVTVRFATPSRAAAESVRALGVDVVEIHPRDDGTVELVAVVSPADRAVLAAREYLPEDVPRPPAIAALEARRRVMGAQAFTVYRDFDDPVRGIAAYLRSLPGSRANVRTDSIGASVEGRPILAVKIGAAEASPTRPNVLFMATYHAREWAATEMALRLVVFLADSLPARAGGAQLLASRDVWVIPVVNPDGYQYTFATQRLWRKNRRPNGDGSYGVDLNRNHTTFFALDDVGSSPVPSSAVYRGPAGESEPETRAVAAFHRAHPPVVAVSYHTYTGLILYPWTQASGLLPPDLEIYQALAGTATAPAVLDSVPLSPLRSYYPAPGWQLYPTNGEYTNWAYREFGTIAFTPELTAGCCVGGRSYGFEFPDDEALLERVFRDNLPFAIGVIQAAGGLGRAVGPSGVAVSETVVEAVGPSFRALLPRQAAAGAALQISRRSGTLTTLSVGRDSLDDGTVFARVHSTDSLVGVAYALRVPPLDLVAEVLAREGGEDSASPWRGMARATGGVEGGASWFGENDTLASPELDLSLLPGARLLFWTRHSGSVFEPARRGRVDLSTDGGATWKTVWSVLGVADAWYPVSVALPDAEGARRVRLRLVSEGFPWYLDAIALTASLGRRFDLVLGTDTSALEVSANPVRGASVTVRWPAAAGESRGEVYTFGGRRVYGTTLPAGEGEWTWMLITDGGAAVANGVYVAVVTRADGRRFRRRLFVAR